MSDIRTVTREQTCPRCAHRPHAPHGCEARYHVTFEAGEPGDPCLCPEAALPQPAPAASVMDLMEQEVASGELGTIDLLAPAADGRDRFW